MFEPRATRVLFGALLPFFLAVGLSGAPPITGNAVAGFAQLEQSAAKLMDKYGIPGMALGVTKAGRLVYARGFGFADVEAGTAVQPDSIFRLASVSKPLTATAADRLVELGKLSYNTKALQVLNFVQPLSGAQLDPRVNQITIEHLINHKSGWADDKGGNRYGDVPAAAKALGLPLPGTFEGLLRFELGRPLDVDPGLEYHYCNFCYGVLGEVVQAASSKEYEPFVTEDVLRRAGLIRTRIGRHLKSQRFPGEVTYYVSKNQPLVPSIYADLPSPVEQPYGGIIFDWGTGSAAGAWVSNTVEMLRLAASVTLLQSPSVFDKVPRTGWSLSGLPIGRGWNWIHTGSIPGTSTELHISDDLAWCILTNTSQNGGAFVTEMDELVSTFLKTLTTWPSDDQFPSHMPMLSAGGPFIFDVSDGASFKGNISSGSWITIQGQNLAAGTRAWRASDFKGDLLPTSLDGTSMSVNGKPAFVSYISPTQVNALAPDDGQEGFVDVQVTSPKGTSRAYVAAKRKIAPALFTFGGRHVAAVHADGSYVAGPWVLGGIGTPAVPGETILLFGTGFGPATSPLDSGRILTAPLPIAGQVRVRIGGYAAPVQYAGVISSGLVQLNVLVPLEARDGDAPVGVTVDGVEVQGQLVLTIKR